MQLALQNLLNRQIQAAESGFAFRQIFHDRHDIPVEPADTTEFADYEDVSFAGLAEELMEIRTTTNTLIRDIEREATAAIGRRRFAKVTELLLRVRQSERMI